MTTALARVEGNTFLALAQQDEQLAAAMEAMGEVGERIGPSDLIRVKVPGEGKTKWMIDTIAGSEVVDSLSGILVFIQRRGVLWPGFDAVEGSSPVLVTDDLLVARQVGQIPDDMIETLEAFRIDRTKNEAIYQRYGIPKGSKESLYNWDKLPYNKFGTGKNGSGKRCKEQRVLYILRPGSIYPVMIVAPPGSIKAVSDFLKHLPEAARVPYWNCIVSLKLEATTNDAGQKYARIVPTLDGVLSSEDAAIIKEKFTDVLKSFADEIDIDGQSE